MGENPALKVAAALIILLLGCGSDDKAQNLPTAPDNTTGTPAGSSEAPAGEGGNQTDDGDGGTVTKPFSWAIPVDQVYDGGPGSRLSTTRSARSRWWLSGPGTTT